MKKFKKIISIILVATVCALPFFPVSLLIWKASTTQNDFVLANYQSYINPEVSKELSQEYGLSYDYFDTPESALNLIKKNTADIVNTTTYDLVNWVKNDPKKTPIQKLDWSKFHIPGVNNAADALDLFIPSLQGVLTGYDLDQDGTNDNLLDYGIPYFLQDYIFAYRGAAIPELEGNLSWKELIDTLSKDGVKQRFAATKYPQIFAVEDPRSFLSIAHRINGAGKDSYAFDTIVNQYKDLANRLNKISNNVMALNPDANVVLNKLATKQVQGAFCFNGDALFASFGGDEEAEVTANDFHVVKPTDTIAALDMFTINSNLSGDKLDKAYQVLGQLCLGIYQGEDGNNVYPTDATYNPELSWTYRNFDYVNYTAPLKKVNEYIKTSYFDGEVGAEPIDPNLKALREKIFDVNVSGVDNFEQPIDDIDKSNISFAWIDFKSTLN